MYSFCIFGLWDLTGDIDNYSDSVFTYGSINTTILNENKKYKSYPDKFNLKKILNSELKDRLKDNNIRILNIGSDHILDYRKSGLMDTIQNLNKEDIICIGAGVNINELHNYSNITDDNEINCIFITGTFYPKIWGATKDKYGVNYINPNDPSFFVGTVIKILSINKKSINIVSINYKKKYVREFERLSERLILLGVNIVIGVSNYIGGFRKINKGYIFYSLGEISKDHIYLNITAEKDEIKEINIQMIKK